MTQNSMEGVIIFADDHIFESDRFENKLFHKLNKEDDFSILPIDNLITLEKAVTSISTYRALILDWNFKREAEEDVRIPDENPFDILKDNTIFSLIFIYSENEISQEKQDALKENYPDKIFFLQKQNTDKVDIEYYRIVQEIQDYEAANLHLETPYIWSQAINQSVQSIFQELETADKLWIKDLYYSSYFFKKDKPIEPPPIDPNIQVIDLFQNILSEHLIQNVKLRKSIGEFSEANLANKSSEPSLRQLYARLYYTKALETDSVMTGDVYEISTGDYAVIISPECDMNTLIRKDEDVELLCFKKDNFNNIASILGIKEKGKDKDTKIKRAYNQENPRIHLLPVFPIEENEFTTALIDFRFSMQHLKGSFLNANKAMRKFKINSPYIQQLRQRYLAYIGRVGVPTIPESLRILGVERKVSEE